MAFKSTNFYYDNKSGVVLTSSDSLTANQSSIQSSLQGFVKVGGGVDLDEFGRSVAVGSNRIVVGIPNDDSNAVNSGMVSVYDLDNTHLFNLTGSTTDNRLGYKVAVGEKRIAVTWFNSTQMTVTVYDLSGNALFSKTPDTGNSFGYNVVIGNNRILISGWENPVPIIYMYDLDGNLIKKINFSSTSSVGQGFTSLAVGSERIVAGNMYGISSTDSLVDTGFACIYDIDGNLIKEISEPSRSGNYLHFGAAVAVGNGRIVITQDHSIAQPTKFYIYDLNGNLIRGPIADQNGEFGRYDFFGSSVAISGTNIIFNRPGGNNYNGTTKPAVDFYDLTGNFLFSIDMSSIVNHGITAVSGEEMSVNNGKIVIGVPYDESDTSPQKPGKVVTLDIPNSKDIFSLF